jgi:hypothetical protein
MIWYRANDFATMQLSHKQSKFEITGVIYRYVTYKDGFILLCDFRFCWFGFLFFGK